MSTPEHHEQPEAGGGGADTRGGPRVGKTTWLLEALAEQPGEAVVISSKAELRRLCGPPPAGPDGPAPTPAPVAGLRPAPEQ